MAGIIRSVRVKALLRRSKDRGFCVARHTATGGHCLLVSIGLTDGSFSPLPKRPFRLYPSFSTFQLVPLPLLPRCHRVKNGVRIPVPCAVAARSSYQPRSKFEGWQRQAWTSMEASTCASSCIPYSKPNHLAIHKEGGNIPRAC
jgi:hypothetical protein